VLYLLHKAMLIFDCAQAMYGRLCAALGATEPPHGNQTSEQIGAAEHLANEQWEAAMERRTAWQAFLALSLGIAAYAAQEFSTPQGSC
jgi:hypothetical protein